MEQIIVTIISGIFTIAACVLANKYSYDHLKELMSSEFGHVREDIKELNEKISGVKKEEDQNIKEVKAEIKAEVKDLDKRARKTETEVIILQGGKIGRDVATGRFTSLGKSATERVAACTPSARPGKAALAAARAIKKN